MLEEGRYQGTCTYQYTMNGAAYSEHSGLNNNKQEKKHRVTKKITLTPGHSESAIRGQWI